ncbi:MAG TPA: hypothetical protein VGQ62_06285, partial [Chloroflexota bacterium]|nr:hypothetical protein [Chloroflexota bacterium]
MEILHAHGSCPLVVLLAPAGFGKSTLAAAYARESGAVVAWVTLQPGHADTAYLFKDVAEALEVAFGDGNAVPELRRGLGQGADGAGLGRFLAADLRRLAADFILVLDDFHLLGDAPEAHQSVDALIRRLPDGGQVVITARVPPLLSATELASDGRIFVLGLDDLRLTVDETAQLRAAIGGNAERDAQAAGWIAGILLGGAPGHLGVAGGQMLAGFVEKEVLAHLRPQERRWLETLSVVETVTPRALELLLGNGAWASRLATLAERCAFLIRGEGGNYRIHALVRDTLLERLRCSGRGRSDRAWTIARSLAMGSRDTAGAVRACQELGRVDDAVGLVRQGVDDAMRVGRWAAALQLLKLLPEVVRSADPDLLLSEAHVLIQGGFPEPAQRAAEAALELGGRSGSAAVQVSALIELANIARYTGDATAADDWLTSAEFLLRRSNLPTPVRRLREGRAFGLRGVCLSVRGQTTEAREALEAAERILAPDGESRELGVVLYNLGLVCIRCGDYGAAQRALAASIAHWRVLGDRSLLASTQILLGSLQLRLSHLESAGATLASALVAVRATGAVRLEAHVLASIGAW